MIAAAVALGAVLEDGDARVGGDTGELLHVAGQSRHVDGDDNLRAWAYPGAYARRGDEARVEVDVSEDGHRVQGEDGRHGTDIRHGRGDHLVALGDTKSAESGMQRCSTRGDGDGMAYLEGVTQGRFELTDNAVRTHQLATPQGAGQLLLLFGAIPVRERVLGRLGFRSAANSEFFHASVLIFPSR